MTAPFGAPAPGYGRPPTPGPVPGPPATGAARIEEALAALEEVRDAPPAEQVAPLANAQRVLRATLDSIGDV